MKSAVILCALILAVNVVKTQGDTPSASYSKRRPAIAESRNDQVLATLSRLVYGVRLADPNILNAVFSTKQTAKDPAVGDGMNLALDAFRPAKAFQNLMICRPEITWRDNTAIVECVMIWHLKYADGTILHWTGREQFSLTPDGVGFGITSARVTPIIFHYGSDRKAFQRHMAEMQRVQQ